MAKKIVLPDLSYVAWGAGEWSGSDVHGTVRLCQSDLSQVLKLKKKHEYRLKLYLKRPKRWLVSGTLVVEPTFDGNVLFYRTRGVSYQLPPDTAQYILNHEDMLFEGLMARKIWIRVKKLKR
jgi:hypothetical protein